MGAILGTVLVVTVLIAAGIASMSGRNAEPPSPGRFILRFIVAWILVVLAAALLLFGACAIMLGGGGGCINC